MLCPSFIRDSFLLVPILANFDNFKNRLLLYVSLPLLDHLFIHLFFLEFAHLVSFDGIKNFAHAIFRPKFHGSELFGFLMFPVNNCIIFKTFKNFQLLNVCVVTNCLQIFQTFLFAERRVLNHYFKHTSLQLKLPKRLTFDSFFLLFILNFSILFQCAHHSLKHLISPNFHTFVYFI